MGLESVTGVAGPITALFPSEHDLLSDDGVSHRELTYRY